jgi:hypothetical protein
MIVRAVILDNNIIKLIQSDDYRDRLQGEYFELLEHTNKLGSMIFKYDKGVLDFKPNTPIAILRAQLNAMESYLNILDYRISIECPENWSSD